MNLSRLRRIPKRLREDLKIVYLTSNWYEVLIAKLKRKPIRSIRVRTGVVLNSPEEVSLDFLFHEIWIEEFYAPRDYRIKANETVIDIGANIGVFATWAATRAPHVTVFSYEPFPESADYFRKNQTASGLANIVFHQTAIAGCRGKRILQIGDSWILHSLAEAGEQHVGIEVECLSLDDAVAAIERCDLLKLDCEGAEYEILYSASTETLKKIGRIVCEFNVLEKADNNGEGLSAFFKRNGFQVNELRQLNSDSGFICARQV